MAYFDQDFINELLAKADIENVVSDYVSLQNKSGRLWGLCPFHSEKTPSFSVTKDKQIFYCFGCHEGGNAIGFLMKIDKLTFPEAVEHLAERVNMPLPKQTHNADFEKNKQRRKKIYEINKKAGLYYYENLKSAKGKKALEYLNNRGLDDKIFTKFGLGYASETWDDLLNHLLKAGYNQQDIKDAGLCSIKNNKAFDSFRNRVIFPIFNVFGDVIGFGGRVMDDSMPKYLNTSDTFAFNKRKNVYALNFVKAIKKLQSIVLVEGYMDVISLYAKGIYNAVATLGTALTKEQAQLIKRYVPLVYIAYDGDNAGKKAALKAVDIIEQVGLQAKVIKFSEGLDPDDFIKAFGYNAFVNQVKNAHDAMSYRLDKLKENYNLDEAQSKAKYVVESTNLLKKLSNPIEREQYILRLSKETGHSTQAIKDQLTAVGGNKVKTGTQYGVDKKTPQNSAHVKLEKMALKYFIAYPKKMSFYDMDKILPYFGDESIKAIISLINLKIKEGILPTNAEMLTDLDETAKQVAGEVMTTLDEKEVQGIDIAHIIEMFEIRALEAKIDALYEKSKAEKNMDTILAEISELNRELHNKKKKPD